MTPQPSPTNLSDELDSIIAYINGCTRKPDGTLFLAQADYLKGLIARHTKEAVEAAELRLLERIEDMGIGEAKKQGYYTVHDMDGYHRAYGEIVSHNVHAWLAAPQQSTSPDEGSA